MSSILGYWPLFVGLAIPVMQASAAVHLLLRRRDVRVEGPVVAEIQEVFAEGWTFSTGERLVGEKWFPRLTATGTSVARGIRSRRCGESR